MLYRALAERAKAHPDKLAVAGEERSLTFGQLRDEVDRAASFLRELNVKAETPIVLGVPPSPDFYVFFYAASSIGATVVPVLPSGKLPQTIRDIRPLLAVGEKSFLKAAEAFCPGLRASIVWDKKAGFQTSPTKHFPHARKKLVRSETILGILTSGTTGEPTLHYTSAETLWRHGRLRAEVMGIKADDVILSTRPFNNMSSLDAPVILPIVSSCKVVVRERFQRFAAAEIISKERVTVVYGVPIIFEMLASIPAAYPADFSSLRLCVSGGAPLSRFVYDKFFQRFGVRIRQRYGGTQFFPAFNFDAREIPGTVGQIAGPFPMTVVDDAGREAAAGDMGEIVLDFSKLKDPFWRSCLKNNPDRRGRYIHTGDLGRVDAEGNLHIVGRKSLFIKVGGNRVAPAEVESVLRSHPKVRDTIVFAHRPGQRDEAVGAVVIRGGRLSPKELLTFCSKHLDPFKCPRRIDFRRTLPRNPQGKIIRYRFQSFIPVHKGAAPA